MFDDNPERTIMVNRESQQTPALLSTEGRYCKKAWQNLEHAARDAVKYIPFDLWERGEKQVTNLTGAGMSHAVQEWKKWHFYKIRNAIRFPVHLGVDGMLYELDNELRPVRRYEASAFTYDEIRQLEYHFERLFRYSAPTERLHVRIETAIQKANTPPCSKILDTAYRVNIQVVVPMPGDRCKMSRETDGSILFREAVWVRRLKGTEYSIDEKDRLVSSARYSRPTVVHLRSIMERERLRTLQKALEKA